MGKPQRFKAHETARTDAADGLLLATFWQRAIGFTIDFAVVAVLRKPVEFLWRRYVNPKWEHHTLIDFHHIRSLLVLVIYFACAVYFGRGQTPGKRIAGTKVLSLDSERLSLWHSTERALGYGASMLEGGFGFIQFFFHRNRQCVHDRIAETIVVDVRPVPGRAL